LTDFRVPFIKYSRLLFITVFVLRVVFGELFYPKECSWPVS